MCNSDILCEICKSPASKVPNEIVICDCCQKGYHQLCHTPQIPSAILVPDLDWICRNCFTVMDIKQKQRFGIVDEELAVDYTDTSRSCSSSSSSYCSNEERELTELERSGLTNQVAQHSPLDDRNNDEVVQKLSYNLEELVWDAEHLTNTSNIYCYCARGVEYCRSMLQCCSCKQWFHTFCIRSLQSELLIGDQYFKFVCSVCGDEGQESCKRITMKWSAVVGLTLSNLTYGSECRFFSVKTDIIPFLVENENLFKLSHSLDKLCGDELTTKITNHLVENSPAKFISNANGDWSLNVKWPYEDPLTFSPFTSNLESTLAKQKAQQAQFEANKNERIQSGAVRKAASPHQGKSKTKRSKSLKRAADQASLSNWKKRKNRTNQEAGRPKKLEILDFNTAIPFPENWAGKNNPFYQPVSSSDDSDNSNSCTSSVHSVNGAAGVKSEPLPATNHNEPVQLGSMCNQRVRRLSTSSDTAEYRVVNKDANKLVLSRVSSVHNSLNLENNHSLHRSPKANSPALSKGPLISSSANALPANLNTAPVCLSNTSTNPPNVLSPKINGHTQDAKPDVKLDGSYEDKCGDLNGAVKSVREEVNFKLLGQRKTFNGGLEFMIECTEKE